MDFQFFHFHNIFFYATNENEKTTENPYFIVRNRNHRNTPKIYFAQLIVGPAATVQRQIDVALSLKLSNPNQGSSNSHLLIIF